MTETTKSYVGVGTDGSEDAVRAIAYAARYALEHDITLRIVHAVEDPIMASAWGVVFDTHDLEEAGREALTAAVAVAVEAGLPRERVETSLMSGSPIAALTQLSHEAELLVVGRRKIGGLERIFVGSTSVGVVLGAECPVIMVSAASTPESTGKFRRLLVSSDATQRSFGALQWGFADAASRQFALTVLHVVPPGALGWGRTAGQGSERLDAAVAAARSSLEELLEPLRAAYPGVDVTIDVEVGAPLDVIVERSAEVDLVILGSHLATLPGVGLSGVVRGAMAHCVCPVGILRS